MRLRLFKEIRGEKARIFRKTAAAASLAVAYIQLLIVSIAEAQSRQGKLAQLRPALLYWKRQPGPRNDAARGLKSSTDCPE
jgi:hypothetical protein